MEKKSLKQIYCENYNRYQECLSRCPSVGKVVELGSGAGFIKTILPDVMTSDFITYPELDAVVNAEDMPFEDSSIRCFLMTNVFHHLNDSGRFLKEAYRCLVPGGRIYIIDQHVGFFSYFILKYFHAEPFDHQAPVESKGENGARSWIFFKRDLKFFKKDYGELFELVKYNPHSPLRYWLSGGLKKWNLLPLFLYSPLLLLERFLLRLSLNFASFVDIELRKK